MFEGNKWDEFLKDTKKQSKTYDNIDEITEINIKTEEVIIKKEDNNLIDDWKLQTKNRFTCAICDKSFTCKSSLKTHLFIHSGKGSFHCHICNKTFPQRSRLIEHTRTHTGEGKVVACSFCDVKFFKQADLNRHVRKHTGEKPFKCCNCAKSFSRKYGLSVHKCTQIDNDLSFNKPISLETHLVEPTEMPTVHKKVCLICDKSYTRQFEFDSHLRSHRGEKPFSCHICNKSFTRKYNLSVHSCKPKSEKLSCNESFTSESNLKEYTGEKSSIYNEFNGDENTLKNEENLVVNEFEYRDKKFYECSVCLKEFDSKSNKERHECINSKKKPYKCNICKKAFPFQSNLKRHVQIHEYVHANLKPYSCLICTKAFSKRFELKEHVLMHAGERPDKVIDVDKCLKFSKSLFDNYKPLFQCSICNETQNNIKNLTQHLKVMHLSKKKLFQCSICNKIFQKKYPGEMIQNNEKTLKRLSRTCKKISFVCTTCSTLIATKCNLKSHQVVNSDGKEQKCTLKSLVQSVHKTNTKNLNSRDTLITANILKQEIIEVKYEKIDIDDSIIKNEIKDEIID